MKFEKVAILGPGLIGASIGLALKERGLAGQVVGLARKASTLETALRVGAIDAGTHKLEEALSGADLVIIAVPVMAAIEMLKEIGPWADRLNEALLLDVCSTKVQIVEAAQQCLPAGVDFIGSHPMAGAEASGPEHAHADLFVDTNWILTPTAATSPKTLARAEALVSFLGADSLLIPPELHDQIVAEVSHLPHLLSVALMAEAAGFAQAVPQAWQVAATGFRDMTRLAGGNAAVWRDICLTNSAPIIKALADLRKRLEQMEQMIKQQDAAGMSALLEAARQQREQVREN